MTDTQTEDAPLFDEEWAIKVRRSERRLLINLQITMFAILLAPLIGFTLISTMMSSSPAGSPRPSAFRSLELIDVRLYWVAAAVLVLMSGIVLRLYRQRQFIRKSVLRTQGAFCPHCRKDMTRMQAESNDDSGTQLACPKCKQELPELDVIGYWQTIANEKKPKFPPGEPQSRVFFLFKFSKKTRQSLWFVILVFLPMPAVMIGMDIARGSTWLETAMGAPQWLCFWFGMGILMWSFIQRKGDEHYCISCDYKKSPEMKSQRCPECGTWWATEATVNIGKAHPSRIGIAVGGFLFITSFVFQFSARSATQRILPMQSNTTLIAQLGGTSMIANESWALLEKRTLNPSEAATMASELIRVRTESHFPLECHAWMLNHMLANPAHPLQRQYKEEMLVFEDLSFLKPVEAGRPNSMLITIHNLSGYLTTHDSALIINAITVDDVPLEGAPTNATQLEYVSTLPVGVGPFRNLWTIPNITMPPGDDQTVRLNITQLLTPRYFGNARNATIIERDEKNAVLSPDGAVWQIDRVIEFQVD